MEYYIEWKRDNMRYEYNLSMDTFFDKEEGILKEHWDQLAGNKARIKLSPNKEMYNTLQNSNMLFNIIAYNDIDEIIGYSIIIITPNLHYSEDKYAMVDVIFVKESARTSRAGIDLINKSEEISRRNGASVILYHTKPAHATLEKILYRKGFKHYENILGKLIKE